jgi:hypothetical protein
MLRVISVTVVRCLISVNQCYPRLDICCLRLGPRANRVSLLSELLLVKHSHCSPDAILAKQASCVYERQGPRSPEKQAEKEDQRVPSTSGAASSLLETMANRSVNKGAYVKGAKKKGPSPRDVRTRQATSPRGSCKESVGLQVSCESKQCRGETGHPEKITGSHVYRPAPTFCRFYYYCVFGRFSIIRGIQKRDKTKKEGGGVISYQVNALRLLRQSR